MQALISWANVSIYLFIYFVFHSIFEKDIEKFEYKSDQEGENLTHILVKTTGLKLYWNDKSR